jgi:hypothetical protein
VKSARAQHAEVWLIVDVMFQNSSSKAHSFNYVLYHAFIEASLLMLKAQH